LVPAGTGKTGVQQFFYITKDGLLMETQTNKLGPERVAALTMVAQQDQFFYDNQKKFPYLKI
jgi:hypothetical protein